MPIMDTTIFIHLQRFNNLTVLQPPLVSHTLPLWYYLVETNIAGVLTEALTAEVQVVLADQSTSLGADTAIIIKRKEAG